MLIKFSKTLWELLFIAVFVSCSTDNMIKKDTVLIMSPENCTI
jgi:hypothetical protein